MQRGKVKWFNDQKGYGFITGDDGKDAFIHLHALPEGADGGDMTEGRAVEFDTEQGPKGLRCKAVRLLAILLLATCGLMAGCSDLQARGEMAVAIDDNAKAAGEIKPQAVAGTLTVDTCIVTLAENAEKFNQYDAAKTLNWFEYAFGKKQIWVNPTYAELLGQTAAAADLAKTQATTRPASWCNKTVAAECSILMRVKQAKDGKKD